MSYKQEQNNQKKKKTPYTRYIIGLLVASTVGVMIYTQLQLANIPPVTTETAEKSTTQSSTQESPGYITPGEVHTDTQVEQEETTESSSTFEKEQPRLDLQPYEPFLMEEKPADPTTDSMLQLPVEEQDESTIYLTWGNLLYYIKNKTIQAEGYDITAVTLNQEAGNVTLTVVPNTAETQTLTTQEQTQQLESFIAERFEPLLRNTTVGTERWYQGVTSIELDLTTD